MGHRTRPPQARMPKEVVDLVDIAQWTLEKAVGRMKKRRLTRRTKERMRLLECALNDVNLARF